MLLVCSLACARPDKKKINKTSFFIVLSKNNKETNTKKQLKPTGYANILLFFSYYSTIFKVIVTAKLSDNNVKLYDTFSVTEGVVKKY